MNPDGSKKIAVAFAHRVEINDPRHADKPMDLPRDRLTEISKLPAGQALAILLLRGHDAGQLHHPRQPGDGRHPRIHPASRGTGNGLPEENSMTQNRLYRDSGAPQGTAWSTGWKPT